MVEMSFSRAIRSGGSTAGPVVVSVPSAYTGSIPLLLILLFLVLLFGCGDRGVSWRSPVAFDTAGVSVVADGDTSRLRVEVAETEEQRGFGLMVRPELEAGSGMIFLYDSIQPDTAGFWMWRTRMPLDIAFLDSAGTIVAIRRMEPCESPYAEDCPNYPPGEPYLSALEVNRGWFEERGIGVGDRVLLDSLAPSPPDGE
ncbi:MAG: DUF192 domain-containing protein [Longimicrobiales bacterium]